MKSPEQIILEYLTKFRKTLNLAGLASEVGTSRQALDEFINGKRGISAEVKSNFLFLFQAQLAVLDEVPKGQF